jgi:hypothetical protein
LRLRLRRGIVVGEEPLTVEVDGERRPAWADTGLLGEMREGDEVIVNVAALDLGLGSGGFDVVHVNLTRGLGAGAEGDEHVMKLNYTSLQHPVEPVELPQFESSSMRNKGTAEAMPALVLPLHGHLAPAAWALAQVEPGVRAGYVQTSGGSLPGALSRDVAELRRQGLLAGHVTAGSSYGGEHEAISVAGALAAAGSLGWDVALVGPGPGIIGSATELGHGGMAALDSAHAALALGCRTLLSPRLSSADPRERHRGASHHTLTVLSMLLAAVEVPVPEPSGLEPALGEARASLAAAAGERHSLRVETVDLDGYAASGLPVRTMGRGIEEDPLFFAAPLAAGAALRRKG